MVVSILIAAFSIVLVIYWFRYSCILMLRNSSLETEAGGTVDYQFSCGQVKELLRGETHLDGLERALERDYRLVTYLIDHAAGLDLNSLEDRLLMLDCRVMRLYYRATKSAAPERARAALREMAEVLGILARRLDQRAGLRSEA
jgi:hypothetical protein